MSRNKNVLYSDVHFQINHNENLIAINSILLLLIHVKQKCTELVLSN